MEFEVTRYQQFCQLNRNIRSSSDHLIVGIDVAKEKHHAFFGTATGKTILKRLIFENDKAGFDRLLSQTESLRVQNGFSRTVFGLEPTGNYHKSLAEWLLAQGQELVLVAGKAVRDNRELLDNRWDKHDAKDSANVADLISQGKCMFYETPDARICEIRSLLSLRRRLKKQEHSLRMRIRNGLLAKFFPEMDRYAGSCVEENLLIVERCLNPRKIAAMTFPDFVKQVTSTDRGTRQLARLRSIHDAAGCSVGLRMGQADEFEAKLLVEEYRGVRKRIAQLMEKIEALCDEFESYKLLQTIPGFGPYISALVLGAIGDPFRFNNFKQVKRMAGLDLCASRSGKTSDQAVPVISKRGDADLRYALYQAAVIATYHNKDFRALFNRVLTGRERERGIKTKMRVKLAEKMLTIAWTIMKKQEPFTPLYLRVANTRAES
ncbi:MAG: IS110 family transposase [Desulfobacteraceae bacterium]|nr:MAG: IS110 family transposase [Desulfobacteraceae bacterium]